MRLVVLGKFYPLICVSFTFLLQSFGLFEIIDRQFPVLLELQRLASPHECFVAEVLALFRLGISLLEDFAVLENSCAIVDCHFWLLKL